MNQILVLGGGAAGIVAAIAAAEESKKDTKVLLLEQNQRVGKKLLATGNGRCNLDNLHASSKQYLSSDAVQMEKMLSAVGSPLAWFQKHGLEVRSDEQGRVYPYSNQAADFLNLLLYWLDKYKVEVHTECKVKALSRRDREYMIVTENGQKFFGQAVICAMGAKAGPQFGTDGFATRFAKDCGLEIKPEYPCLVPLKCEKSQVSGLSGIRVKATASLYVGDKQIAKEDGEIQFTEQGLSGIAVMQLSNRMRKTQANYSIHLNLFPQMEKEQLMKMLENRLQLFSSSPLSELMTGLVNRRIGLAVCKAGGVDASLLCRELSQKQISALADGFMDWRFTGLAPLEWKQAQTTGGGVALYQIQPDSFMLDGCPGLYFVGETLDCVGDCGGFNLHFAFGSGITAGVHAAKSLYRQKLKTKLKK